VLNKSLGEMDWLSVHSEYLFGNQPVTYICYRITKKQLLQFCPSLFKDENVQVIDSEELFGNYKLTVNIDNFLDRLSTYIFNHAGHTAQMFVDLGFIYLKALISIILVHIDKKKLPIKGKLFHENNDRTTCFFEAIKRSISGDEVIFFPHHFGITTPKNKYTSFIHNKIGVSKCYVNGYNETVFNAYERIKHKKQSKITNDVPVKYLILTRQCSESFGFTEGAAYKSLDKLLSDLTSVLPKSQIYIKNHPRDKDNLSWAKLTDKYSLRDMDYSAIDFVKQNNVICFHLHTTLAIQVSQLGSKCFDVSPYDPELVALSEPLKEQLKLQLTGGYTKMLDVFSENELYKVIS